MITRRHTLPIVAFALAALFAPAVHAQGGGGHVNVRIPMTHTLFNECTEENVTLQGTLHVIARVVEQADGTFRVNGRANAGGVFGTGTSGDRYVGSGQATFSEPFTGFPATVDALARFRLNRQGRGGDARGTATLRVTVDADGNPTLEIMDVVLDCRAFHSIEDS
jgi:hypothetical protein